MPLDTWHFYKALFESTWVSEQLLIFFNESLLLSIHPHLQARLTYTWGNFISWGNNFYYLIKSSSSWLQLQDALCTHICQTSSCKQRRRKFQEALPKQVSRLTIETTSAPPCSCRPSCGPPDKVSTQRLLKGRLQVCFPACAYRSPLPPVLHELSHQHTSAQGLSEGEGRPWLFKRWVFSICVPTGSKRRPRRRRFSLPVQIKVPLTCAGAREMESCTGLWLLPAQAKSRCT